MRGEGGCGKRGAMKIIRKDIAEVAADAIVADACGDWRAGSGVDSAMYRRGGAELRARREAVGHIDVGRAAATAAGGALRCRVVVHAVAPRWRGAARGEERRGGKFRFVPEKMRVFKYRFVPLKKA